MLLGVKLLPEKKSNHNDLKPGALRAGSRRYKYKFSTDVLATMHRIEAEQERLAARFIGKSDVMLRFKGVPSATAYTIAEESPLRCARGGVSVAHRLQPPISARAADAACPLRPVRPLATVEIRWPCRIFSTHCSVRALEDVSSRFGHVVCTRLSSTEKSAIVSMSSIEECCALLHHLPAETGFEWARVRWYHSFMADYWPACSSTVARYGGCSADVAEVSGCSERSTQKGDTPEGYADLEQGKRG